MLVNHHCLLQQQRQQQQQQQPHSPYPSSRQTTPSSTAPIEDERNDNVKESEMIGSRNYTSKRAPDSFALYCAKRRYDDHDDGQQLTTQQLAEEWKNLAKDQKAEFQNQSQCIQFTLDIDSHSLSATDPRKKHPFIPKIVVPPTSSMVIPNDHSADSSPASRGRDDEDEDQDPYYMQNNTSTYHLYHQSHHQHSQSGHQHQQSIHHRASSNLFFDSFQHSSSSSSSSSSSNSDVHSTHPMYASNQPHQEQRYYHHHTLSSLPLSSHIGHHYYHQEQQQHHHYHLMNDTSPLASPPTPYHFYQQRPPNNSNSSSSQSNADTPLTHNGYIPATASTKLTPNLSHAAAAEAAALESLSFNEEKLHAQEQETPLTSPAVVKSPTASTAKFTSIASQSTKRKYGLLPEKVKRPPNAYLLFNRDMRRQLHDVNQGLSSGEISKSISQRWKQLSQIEKDIYFKEEARLKEQHRIGHDNFIYTRRSKAEMKQAGSMKKKQQQRQQQVPSPQPPNEQNPMASTTMTTTRKQRSAKRKQVGRDPRGRKKKKPDDTLPKHPMSAYLHFAKEMWPIMKQRFPDARLVEISKAIGNEWRAMTQIELQKWLDVANLDKARYAKEMKARIILGQQQEHVITNDDAQSLYSASSENTTTTIATTATTMSPLSIVAATTNKRKYSSFSPSSTHHSASNAAAMDDLDSDIIASVARMVNSNVLSTQNDNNRGI
ncbi:hypothetical protein [Parasitella parasitica]|uniref:HMG box domain-containing protein n=1 Tax=Parasitella parasitica TaxID=35722 RepID=A0A0B7NBL8_9FUNG|nr:hypothetical protein [Parasitella parasitica]